MSVACDRRSRVVWSRAPRRASASVPKPANSNVAATVPRITSVSRRVMCRPLLEPVTDAAHGREREAVAQLLAQLTDVHVDGPFVAVPVGTPRAVEQLAA